MLWQSGKIWCKVNGKDAMTACRCWKILPLQLIRYMLSLACRQRTSLYKVSDNDSVSFKLGKQEPYARITAVYNKGTQLLLNPVFRYKTSPLYQSTASINSTQTSLLRTAGVIALLVWFGLILKLPLPQKAQKKLLPNISTNSYGYISNIHSKIIKVRHRRIIGHLRELFYNMDDERETKIK